jgi:hypothetical protein
MLGPHRRFRESTQRATVRAADGVPADPRGVYAAGECPWTNTGDRRAAHRPVADTTRAVRRTLQERVFRHATCQALPHK